MEAEEEVREPSAVKGTPEVSQRHRSPSVPSTTWLSSSKTPNRLSKVESPPSRLNFREMRGRTVVIADGVQACH